MEANHNKLNELLEQGYQAERNRDYWLGQLTIAQSNLNTANEQLDSIHRQQEVLIRQEICEAIVFPAMQKQFSLKQEIQDRRGEG